MIHPSHGGVPTEPAATPLEPEHGLDDGVDVTLIRWMLSLTPEARLDVLQGFVDSVAEISGAEPRA
jgi:hypothetical protein